MTKNEKLKKKFKNIKNQVSIINFRCDGDDDCGDWSDEEGCPKIAGGFCAESEFR
jgi:hypothetical protein